MGKLELSAAGYKKSDDLRRCATCMHFSASNNICSKYSARVRPDHVSSGYEQGEGGSAIRLSEMMSSSAKFSEGDDGLVWKPILRTGEWKLSPGIDGQPVPKPLKVVYENAGPDEIALSDIVHAFNDGAIEQVTVPLSHHDRPDENTGYIKGLKITDPDENGERKLLGGFHFTEPDIKQKALNGSLPNCSVGLLFDYFRKSDAKKYGVALAHVAITSKPWINGLEPFGQLAASQDLEFDEVVALTLSEEDEAAGTEGATATVEPGQEEPETTEENEDDELWSDADSLAGIQRKLIAQLPEGFDIVDMGTEKVLIAAEDEGSTYVASYAQVDGEPVLEAQDQWKATKRKWVQASESQDFDLYGTTLQGRLSLSEAREARKARLGGSENNERTPKGGDDVGKEMKLSEDQMRERLEALEAENKRLAAEQRKNNVEAKIAEYGEMGLSEFPGLLKELRTIMLSDDGQPALALMLSEDGSGSQTKEITATEIVERIVDALPKKDGKLALSEQVVNTGNGERPKDDATDELDPVKAADEAIAAMGLSTGKGGES